MQRGAGNAAVARLLGGREHGGGKVRDTVRELGRHQAYVATPPHDADRLVAELPGMPEPDRLGALDSLNGEHRRWLARDQEFVASLRTRLSPGEFARTAAYLMVDLDDRVTSAPSARREARARVEAMLRDPDTTERLLTHRATVMVVPKDVPMTEVSAFRYLAGTHAESGAGGGRGWDDVRGSGGRHAAVTEENLLGDHTTIGGATHYEDGYSTTTHEFAHTLHDHGLSDDDRERIARRYQEKLADPAAVWPDGSDPRNYSRRDDHEFFAQLTNAYLGTNHGEDPYSGERRNNGSDWVRAHEADLLPLLERVYGAPSAKGRSPSANPVGTNAALYEGFREFWSGVGEEQHAARSGAVPHPPPLRPVRSGTGPPGAHRTSPPPQAPGSPGAGTIKPGAEAELIGSLDGTANAKGPHRTAFVALVPTTADGPELSDIANRYRKGFAGDGPDGNRFGLVLGVNSWEGKDKALEKVQAKIDTFKRQWNSRDFPVGVLGFVWGSHKVKEAKDIGQDSIPYGEIRQHIMKHPLVTRLVNHFTDTGSSHVYLHTSDSDTLSFVTPAGPLFSEAAARHLDADDPPDLLSGGYTAGADDRRVVRLAVAIDLAVRKAMAGVDPKLVYFPEPNTFVKVRTDWGMDGLEDGIGFGTGKGEGQNLLDSVEKVRSAPVTRVFDPGLAISTRADRIGGKVQDFSGGPVTKDALRQLLRLAQTHARPEEWSDRIARGHGTGRDVLNPLSKAVFAIPDPSSLKAEASRPPQDIAQAWAERVELREALQAMDKRSRNTLLTIALNTRKALLTALLDACDELSNPA
ncbi:hypothetical protein OHS33_31365 [Streptomyces sp. NBC_00536]|uniref:hypothetical protein n=1 Tax=Streptomyces sp. NBC_00536 TaxID=2975769 RepID=UPI002E8214FC|nr:hypothetical protein [Streptomyces sp. NBC_00536]WUC82461.1 hypothetical protein OHS33_31365 [Streptomyces sp. NBC_00536]